MLADRKKLAAAVTAAAIIGSGLLLVASPLAQAAPATVTTASATTTTRGVTNGTAEVLATSPSDQALRNISDAQLAKLSIRCTVIDGLTYCLHWGWTDAGLADDGIQQHLAERTDGDRSLYDNLRQWASQPMAQRVAAERAELADAESAVGKVKLMQYRMAGQQIPASFWTRHPQALHGSGALPNDPQGPPSEYYVGSPSKTMKQTVSYWCGPTSMAIMAWNDPRLVLSHDPAHWAHRLGTTRNGTAITAMARVTNSDTTWDSNAGPYAVHSISTWSNQDWRILFMYQIGRYHAPVILHPKLDRNVSTYYPGTTSGHFDVGRGYKFNSGVDKISIFEPAGRSLGVPNVVSEYTDYVRRANLNNTIFKNIAY